MAAGIVARLIDLPRRAVVLADDETHLNLLPHVRASRTLRGARPEVPTPGKNRQVTVFGALEVTTGAWACRLGRRCAADFTALPDQVLRAFPRAPVIVMICDNDSIHHARKVTAYLQEHPEGARSSMKSSLGNHAATTLTGSRPWSAAASAASSAGPTWSTRSSARLVSASNHCRPSEQTLAFQPL